MTMDPGYELYDLTTADLDEQSAAQAAGIPDPPDPVTSPAALAFEQARADYDAAYEALLAAAQRLSTAHRHYLTTIRSTP